MTKIISSFLLIVILLLFSCNKDDGDNEVLEFKIVSQEENKTIKALLDGRLFRKYDPSSSTNTQKTIIVSFISDYVNTDSIIQLWGQQAEEGFCISEWEIRANDFSIYKATSADIFKFVFINPFLEYIIPDDCDDCLDVSNIILYVKQLNNEIEFLLDQEMDLPFPYPVFTEWTKFDEVEK